MESPASEENIASMIRAVSVLIMVTVNFGGVGLGLIKACDGVCKAAEYPMGLALACLPFVFTTAPAVYALLMYFMFGQYKPTTIVEALALATPMLIGGLGGGMTGYAVGNMAAPAIVTRVQQKKFGTTFFMVMLFGEIIGILGICIAVIAKNK